MKPCLGSAHRSDTPDGYNRRVNTREWSRKAVSNEQPRPDVQDGVRPARSRRAAPPVLTADSDYPGLARDYARLLAHIDNSVA